MEKWRLAKATETFPIVGHIPFFLGSRSIADAQPCGFLPMIYGSLVIDNSS